MMLLAIVLPPLAVLMCGKPGQALLNFFLTLLGWLPGVIHAMAVVGGYQADQRTRRLQQTLERQHREEMAVEARRQQLEAARRRSS